MQACPLLKNDIGRIDAIDSLDRRIVEQHRGRLAAELERQPLERPRARLGDGAPGVGAAGEHHSVDTLVGDQCGPDVGPAGHDVHDPGRDAGRLGRLREHERVERGLGGGLEHDRASRRQCGCELGRGRHDRPVEGHHRSDHADWFAYDECGCQRALADLARTERRG